MAKLPCPVCQGQTLDPLTDSDSGLEVDSCPGCLGVWFDAAELSEFYKSPELIARLTPAGGGSLHHTYEISARARLCPRCRKAMERPHVGGIAVDVCKSCRGIWFDHGELRKITEIHKTRGLRGDDEVTEQVRQGTRGGSKGGSGTLEVLGWFFNSFLGTRLR
jgi:Zn-finger nucleic acid-binding protein